MKSVYIINTGGTFNKRYDPLKGHLVVPNDDKAVKRVVKSFYNLKIKIKNIIHKDSLDFNDEDRKILLQEIKSTKAKNIIVIHGTDTVDKSSQMIKRAKLEKRVIFTGSMVPFSVEQIEPTANLSQAIGFLSANPKNGVYIAMHGIIANSEKLIKNRAKGQFLLTKKEEK